jgi:ribosomal protein S24E
MYNQQNIEIENLIQNLARLIGYSEAKAYYERVYADAASITRFSPEYIKEKMNSKILGETLRESC